jgi:tight adherence protein B
MMLALIVVGVLAIALLGAAAWMYSMAQGRERQEAALGRMHSGEQAGPAIPDPVRSSNPLLRSVGRLLWRAGNEMSPAAIVRGLLLLAVAMALAWFIGGWLFGSLINSAALAVIYLVLSHRAKRRRVLIIEQLPGFLENVIRVLSAGNSLEESLASAAREASDPIRPLFMSVSRQVQLGAPVDQVLAEAGDLYRVRDLKVISLAAAVNRKYGGSLRMVFKSLINAIRQRGTAARELRALTAETRFSAILLSILPVGLTIFIYLQNRAYYIAMLKDPTGFWLIVGAVALQFAGSFLLWRMVNSTEGGD